MRTTLTCALLLVALAALTPTALALDREIEVQLHELGEGTLHLLPPEINAETGDRLLLNVVNQGAGEHDLLVCGEPAKPQPTCGNVLAQTARIPAGASERLTVELTEPGTFDYYSSLFGEKAAGMRGTLHVTGEPTKKGMPSGGVLLALAASAGALVLLGRRHA